MNTSETSGDQQQPPLTSLWEAKERAFIEQLRASGRTVKTAEASGLTEFVATFPQGRPPSLKQASK